VRIYHKPLVLLIWFGPVLMAFGGLLSLSDRRLRVGAPKPPRPRAGCRRRSRAFSADCAGASYPLLPARACDAFWCSFLE